MALVTGHIGINVTDLQRSSSFYANALGLQHIGGSAEGDQIVCGDLRTGSGCCTF